MIILKTNTNCECPLADSDLYIYITQEVVGDVKVTYTWYKCVFTLDLTNITPHVVILEDISDLIYKKR